ncbi:MAG: hypothetical protein Kow00127_02140 [Bacteroidales bacterium]
MIVLLPPVSLDISGAPVLLDNYRAGELERTTVSDSVHFYRINFEGKVYLPSESEVLLDVAASGKPLVKIRVIPSSMVFGDGDTIGYVVAGSGIPDGFFTAVKEVKHKKAPLGSENDPGKDSVSQQVKPVDELKVEKSKAENGKVRAGTVEFRVQLLASKVQLDKNSKRFEVLKDKLIEEYDGEYYRYFSGPFDSSEAATDEMKRLRKSGFGDAFVVAWQNGKRVPLKKVRPK